MKIRLGHVTNSSSSSFIIVGRKSSLEEILANTDASRAFYVIGTSLSEGVDVFKVSPENISLIPVLDESYLAEFRYYEAYQAGHEKLKLDQTLLDPDSTVFVFEAGDWSSTNLEQFMENYL